MADLDDKKAENARRKQEQEDKLAGDAWGKTPDPSPARRQEQDEKASQQR